MTKKVILLTAIIVALFSTASTAVAQNRPVIKYTPGMSLAGQATTDMVQMPSGRQLSVETLRRLSAAAQKLRTAPTDRMPAVLKVTPAATGRQLRSSQEIAAALKQGDPAETVQLPSGRLVTVGQLRLMQPLAEKVLGYKLDTVLTSASLTGPATKFTRSDAKAIGAPQRQAFRAQWEDILRNQRDDKILESPSGIRITVGQAKEYLAKQSAAKRALTRDGTKTSSSRALPPAAKQQPQKGRAK